MLARGKLPALTTLSTFFPVFSEFIQEPEVLVPHRAPGFPVHTGPIRRGDEPESPDKQVSRYRKRADLESVYT